MLMTLIVYQIDPVNKWKWIGISGNCYTVRLKHYKYMLKNTWTPKEEASRKVIQTIVVDFLKFQTNLKITGKWVEGSNTSIIFYFNQTTRLSANCPKWTWASRRTLPSLFTFISTSNTLKRGITTQP